MARTRFIKLSEEKQLFILDTAAVEFCDKGYGGASINSIISKAGLSKGAAYYYFDDKADLYLTTIKTFFNRMGLAMAFQTGLATCLKKEFWKNLEKITGDITRGNLETPWRLGILRSVQTIPPDSPLWNDLAEIFHEGMNFFTSVIERGRELNLIRRDLPVSYLSSQYEALNDGLNKWIVSHIQVLSDQEIDRYIQEMILSLRRIMEGAV